MEEKLYWLKNGILYFDPVKNSPRGIHLTLLNKSPQSDIFQTCQDIV